MAAGGSRASTGTAMSTSNERTTAKQVGKNPTAAPATIENMPDLPAFRRGREDKT